MFFFLSKFLPLLVYPLGLTCLLMIVAVIGFSQKSHLPHKRRWAQGSLVLAILILWLSSTPLAVNLVLGTLEARYADYASLENLPTADAIVVLGGATLSSGVLRRYPEISDAGDRIFHAVRLYRSGKAPKILLAGGYIRWGDQPNTAKSEAEDMQQLLTLFQIPPEDILLEKRSLNTYQNAIKSQIVLQENQLQSILLVTSAFHMPRSLAIFQKLGIDAIPAPTDFRALRGYPLSLQQFGVDLLPESENLYKVSIGLKEYLGFWVYRLRGWL